MSAGKQKYSMALDSYSELKDELSALPAQPKPASPSLSNVIAEVGPLPHEVLFLGVATDGLPVLLNLHDPVPGPLLVTGESKSGKTSFLQSVVRSVLQTHRPNDLQYGIVTNRPDEWDEIENSPHRAGIFSTNDTGAQDLILSMASWAHENRKARQFVLLLVDDLDAIARLEFDSLQSFRWLLARGPSRRVWPIITMDAERYGEVLSWIPLFRTRIFGRIENERVAYALGGDKSSALDELEAPSQFSLRENDSWIRFLRPQ